MALTQSVSHCYIKYNPNLQDLDIMQIFTLQIVSNFSYLKVTANRVGKQGIYDTLMYSLFFVF